MIVNKIIRISNQFLITKKPAGNRTQNKLKCSIADNSRLLLCPITAPQKTQNSTEQFPPFAKGVQEGFYKSGTQPANEKQ